MKHYKAPWCKLLILVSALLTALCLGITFASWFRPGSRMAGWAGSFPLLLVAGAALFTIRGYVVTPDAILVQRLLWATRLPRSGLQSARLEPGALRWSLRAFGNGGFFSISGLYWNRKLGFYRAYLTDPKHAVLLRYLRRTVVLSPDAPEDFIAELEDARSSA